MEKTNMIIVVESAEGKTCMVAKLAYIQYHPPYLTNLETMLICSVKKCGY